MPTRSASSNGVLTQLQGLKPGQRTCLGYIRRRGECSRDEIERYFGWKPETISRALKPLVDQGILLTRSRTPAGQGRRRTFLYLNPELFCAIGVEITFSHIRAAIVDVGGRILSRGEEFEHPSLTPDQAVRRLGQIVADLRRSPSQACIAGVGISFVGSLSHPNDASYCFPGASTWEHYPLLNSVRKVCEVPVEVHSDNVTGALAELRFGHAVQCDNFLFLHMSEGIGLGIVLNGVINAGSRNLGGEFGHICVQPGGPCCYCGGTGCLEAMSSSWAILSKVRGRLQSGVFSRHLNRQAAESLTLADVCRAVAAGEVFVLDVLDTAGEWLGLSLSNAADVLDPDRIILGGILSDETVYTPLIERLKESYHRNVHFYRPRRIELTQSKLGTDSYLVGAAATVFERVLPAHPTQLLIDPEWQSM